MKLIGPFKQIITLRGLPLRGAIADQSLEVLSDAGLLIDNGVIKKLGDFELLKKEASSVEQVQGDKILLPGLVDCHTHICFSGNRANDFAMRNAGRTYLEIAQSGGGIWSSVKHTREADENELLESMLERIEYLQSIGVTTIEIKSGYGLDLEHELKMLRVIQKARSRTSLTLIPTCLAAHMKPKDYEEDNHHGKSYLAYILEEILPIVRKEDLARRVDIFIEKSAFQPEESLEYLEKAKALGFELTVHADQFTPGSSQIAVQVGAKSADHLEASSQQDIEVLAKSNTVAVALPGASLGLGEPFTPARKLLDEGAILAIGSDWNPGSAPMGNLLTQASILATYEKLSTAEVLAGITFRAAHALGLEDRGLLEEGKRADFILFDTDNYQNILYRQGTLSPSATFVNGELQYGKL
ncbi:imidazolonepropionase [Chryseobacterium sp. A301]